MDFNPMSIIGGLVGSISGSGELTEIFQTGQKALGGGDVMGGGKAQKADASQASGGFDLLGSFKLDIGMVVGELEGALSTLFHPCADQNQAAQGYAPPAAPAHQDGVKQGASETDQAISALEIIKDNFSTFDLGRNQGDVNQATQGMPWDVGSDRQVSLADLQNLADDENVPANIRQAAQYLTSHPELTESLDQAGNLGAADGKFGLGNLEVMINELKAEKHAEGSKPAQQGSPAQSTSASQSTTPAQGTPAAQTSPTQSTPPPTAKSESSEPAQCSNLEDRLGAMNQGLDKMEDRLTELMNMDPNKMSADQKAELARLPTDLQRASQRMTELHDLISNLMAAFHEMSMNAINHIR